MLPSWKVKQLTAGCDDEQEEIVAIAGEIKVEQSQQRRDLSYRQSNDVALLHELWLPLFNGLSQESLLIATETGIINESSSIRYRAFYEK